MNREEELLKRITTDLKQEGYKDKPFFGYSSDLPDESFFEYMVSRRLDGQPDPKPQEVWEDMVSIIQTLMSDLKKASENYTKLQKEHRYLQQDLREFMKNERDIEYSQATSEELDGLPD